MLGWGLNRHILLSNMNGAPHSAARSPSFPLPLPPPPGADSMHWPRPTLPEPGASCCRVLRNKRANSGHAAKHKSPE